MLRLRRDLRVRTLVDFRSSEERREDASWSLMLSNGLIRTYDVHGNVVEVRGLVVGLGGAWRGWRRGRGEG